MQTYNPLMDVYKIGEEVSTIARRRQQIAIGLFATGAITLGSVFAFKDSASNPFKAFGYLAAIGCFTSSGVMLGTDKRLKKMGEQFETAAGQSLAADLNYAHNSNLQAKQAESWLQTLNIVQSLPQHMQPGALERFQVGDLVQYPSIEVQAQAIESEQLIMPSGLMAQATLDQSIADFAAQELSIDWFPKWSKRSGIVVGESRDGKSYMLCNIVLSGFIKEHGDDGEVRICDPDYGSSHDDSPPNVWLRLEVGRHIFIKAHDCLKVILSTSKAIDDRVEQTGIAAREERPKPKFSPILLIVDELPELMAKWTEDEQSIAVRALSNILRRGLKQNITFKLGTQTLAVGTAKAPGLGIPKAIVQQTEIVILWRSAQVADNYQNLGLQPGKASELVDQVSLYPHKVDDRFVCVRWAEKRLSIAGIPVVAPVQIVDEKSPQGQEEPEDIGDVYGHLKTFMYANDGDDRALAQEFTKLTGRGCNEEQMNTLKEYLKGL